MQELLLLLGGGTLLAAALGATTVAPALRWTWHRLHGPDLSPRATDLLIAAAVGSLGVTLAVAAGSAGLAIAAASLAGMAPALIVKLRPRPAPVTAAAPPHDADLDGFSVTLRPRPAWVTLGIVAAFPPAAIVAALLGLVWGAVKTPALTVTVRGTELRWTRGPREGRVALGGAVVRDAVAWDGTARLVVHHRDGTWVWPLGGVAPGEVAWLRERLVDAATRPAPSAVPAPPRALRSLLDRGSPEIG